LDSLHIGNANLNPGQRRVNVQAVSVLEVVSCIFPRGIL